MGQFAKGKSYIINTPSPDRDYDLGKVRKPPPGTLGNSEFNILFSPVVQRQSTMGLLNCSIL